MEDFFTGSSGLLFALGVVIGLLVIAVWAVGKIPKDK